MEFGGKEINLDALALDSLSETDIFRFGGPDIVMLEEQRQEELKKKERQAKRLEKERQSRQTTFVQQSHDAKPLGRWERKLAIAMEMSKKTAPNEETNLLNNQTQRDARSGAKQTNNSTKNTSSEDESDNQSSQSRDQSESVKQNGFEKSADLGDSMPQEPLPQPNPVRVFRAAQFSQQDMAESHNNTHLNLQHPIPGSLKLQEYINVYEKTLGEEKLALVQNNAAKLKERRAAAAATSRNQMVAEESDKFTQILIDLCNKQVGLDLNQPLKTLLLHVK